MCYESAFPFLARSLAADEAKLLVVASNDAWFAEDAALEQQLAHLAFRSAETGLSAVRVGNQGLSALTDERGRVVWSVIGRGPLHRILRVPVSDS